MLEALTTALRVMIVVGLVVFTTRRVLLVGAALALQRAIPRLAELPSVTVLVAAHNESLVAERLLAALGRLDYPSERLSFMLVCDGCTDDTPVSFRRWAGREPRARVLVLPLRGGKARALNEGLARSESEIVIVLDADLQPRPDFLRQLLPTFADERVAAVAALLHPQNAQSNLVTRYAAVTSWVHQLVTSAGKDRLGLNPPLLGASAYRRAVLRSVGGFPPTSFGEDAEIGLLITRDGWRTGFAPAAVADNTVVSTLADYWRQHVRWARSTFDTAKRLRAPFGSSSARRVEAWATSIGYGDRLVLLAAAALAATGDLPLWLPAAYLACPGAEVVAGLLKAGVRWRLPSFLVATGSVFFVDVAASIVAVTAHLAGRPNRWDSPRRAADWGTELER